MRLLTTLLVVSIRFALVLFGFGLPLMSQVRVGAGLKAGVPFTAITEAISGGAALVNRTFRWTVGPTLEVDLPFGFGVEFDALYRKVGYEGPAGRGELAGQRREFTDSMWDFPLLPKYRFPGNMVRPYLGGGWTYRRLGRLLRDSGSSSNGAVVAAGLRIGAKWFNISPEIRYTHWPNQDIQPGFRTRKNQFEALIGFTFE